jgi:ankyrin repeat protein
MTAARTSKHSVDTAEELRAAAARGDMAVARRLLEAGAAPNAFDETGLAALHHAAEGEHFEMVGLLLTHGAAINGRDQSRIANTPLAEVAGNCSLRMAILLIEAGANPTLRGWMQLNALDRSRSRKRGDGPAVHDLLVRAAQSWAPGVQ